MSRLPACSAHGCLLGPQLLTANAKLQVSKELQSRSLFVTAHPGLVAVASAGAIGIGTLQHASTMMHNGAAQPGDEWNVRHEIPHDLAFAASTHLIWVGDVTVGDRTQNAAEAFTDLSAMLDHIPGVKQFTREDPDSKLSLRLTGVCHPSDGAEAADAHDDAEGARFSAHLLLQPAAPQGVALQPAAPQAVASRRLEVLLLLLPPAVVDRYDDTNELLAARGKAIKKLADELRSRFATRRNLKGI